MCYRWPWPELGRSRFGETWGAFKSAFSVFQHPLSDDFFTIEQAGLTVAERHEPAAEDSTGLSDEESRRARMTSFFVVLMVLR